MRETTESSTSQGSSAPSRGILVLAGPTAGGKSALGMEIARRVGGEIVCADSMQIYRGLDIGTAKPISAERAEIRHALLDVADPYGDGFTVADWLRLANEAVLEAHTRGKLPILVGGTNLYLRAFFEGLDTAPAADMKFRATLERESDESLRALLQAVDPIRASELHLHDRRRTIRALEVHHLTGKPMSSMATQWDVASPRMMRDRTRLVILDWPVELINRRINARVKSMLEAGFLREVESLHAQGQLGRQAAEAVGYRELGAVLSGELRLDAAFESIKIRTRQYAKQQRVWLRRFASIEGVLRIDANVTDPSAWADLVLAQWPDLTTTA